MGGDDSQKLLPRRGMHSSPGRSKPLVQRRIAQRPSALGNAPAPLSARCWTVGESDPIVDLPLLTTATYLRDADTGRWGDPVK
jgi:hypothetical protein